MASCLALWIWVSALIGPKGEDPGRAAEKQPQATIQGYDLRYSLVTVPAPGPARAIGQPGAGCLKGAEMLPDKGPGYNLVHPERRRNFGHPTLIAFVRRLAAELRREKLAPLFVGDLSQPRGGPTPTGHRSHQNGIDVDLWFSGPSKRFVPGKTPAPAVVDLRTHQMLPSWTPRVARLLEIVAESAEVDRVFVHPQVKRALCEDQARRGPWLGLLRPWWGHHDHFHVRLRCPSDSAECVASQPLPAGDGCDQSLNWWFTEDATRTGAKRKSPGEGAAAMPVQCESLVH